MEGCEFQTQDATKGLTLFSDEPRPKARFTFHYRNPSRRNPEPLQQAWSTTHKRIGSSQVATKGLNRHKRRLGSKDPRVTSSQAFNFHESSWRAQTDAQKQWQEHKKCSNPSLPNSTKATKAYGGIREEEQWRKSTKDSKI